MSSMTKWSIDCVAFLADLQASTVLIGSEQCCDVFVLWKIVNTAQDNRKLT